ncbi:MAG: UDP-3-O-(3-hydroxymyristoyl)glucosamine N-acyltransferase [Planctomycetota bacterium]
MRLSVDAIAEFVSGRVIGDAAQQITGISGLTEAVPGDVSFLADDRYLHLLAESKATAVLVARPHPQCATTQIVVEDPNLSFIEIVEAHGPRPRPLPRRIHASAIVEDDVVIGKSVAIGPNVVIRAGTRIADECVIHANCFIGNDCHIGPGCLLHPNVTIRERCHLGARVIIHAGAVIGADGFGYASIAGVHRKIPQVGDVRIGDDVEIGANATIDRARFDSTVIGRGTKVDNLAMIAHNVEVGEHCIVCGQVGIAGSTTIGNHVMMLGQAGITGHIRIGDGAIIAGKAGVSKNLPAKATVDGNPAQDIREHRKQAVATRRLPQLRETIRRLESRIRDLEARLAEGEGQ